MSTDPPKSRLPHQPDPGDLARVSGYLKSEDWEERVRDAARRRAAAKSASAPDPAQPTRAEMPPVHDLDRRPGGADGQGGQRDTTTGISPLTTGAQSGVAAAASLTSVERMDQARMARERTLACHDLTRPLPESLRPAQATRRGTRFLQSLAGWSLGAVAGGAVFLALGIMLYIPLGLRTGPMDELPTSESPLRLTAIEWTAERLPPAPAPIAEARPGGRASGADVGDVTATAVRMLPSATPPDAFERPPSTAERTAPLRLAAMASGLPADPVDRPSSAPADGMVPAIFRPASPAVRSAEPQPAVDVRPARSASMPTIDDPAASRSGRGPVTASLTLTVSIDAPPVGPVPTPGTSALPRGPDVSAGRPEPMPPALRVASRPDAALLVASLARPNPPVTALAVSAERLAAPVHPSGSATRPRAPRQDTLLPAGWDAPDRLASQVRAILTQSDTGDAEAGRLRALGLTVAEVHVTRLAVPVTRVHYFHGEDARAAVEVAASLGGEAIDLTGFAPRPPQGTLDIQMAE